MSTASSNQQPTQAAPIPPPRPRTGGIIGSAAPVLPAPIGLRNNGGRMDAELLVTATTSVQGRPSPDRSSSEGSEFGVVDAETSKSPNTEVVTEFNRSGLVDAETRAFTEAVVAGMTEQVREFFFVRQTVNVNAPIVCPDGTVNALYVAAAKGQVEIVKCLIKQQASLSICDNKKRTPIHVAILNNKPKTLARLLEYDLDQEFPTIKKKDFEGKTALDIALEMENVSLARVLLKYGASCSLERLAMYPDLQSLMRWNNVYSGRQLNLAKVVHILNKGAKHLEDLSHKDIVLVLGNTGAGKSTLVNYLMGVHFQRNGVAMDKPRAVGAVFAKIGYNNVKSETVYAASYRKDEFEFCDCPGFVENRGPEFQLTTTITMQLVVQKARSIRGIIVVIEYFSFITAKGSILIEHSQQLGQVLKDAGDCSRSVFFVYTKVPPEQRDLLLDYIDKFIEERARQASDFDDLDLDDASPHLRENSQSEALRNFQVLRILNLMKSTWHQSVVVDLFSDASRLSLLQSLKTAIGISRENIKFSMQDSLRSTLDKAVFDAVELANRLFDQIKDLNDAIERSESTMSEVRESIQSLESRISRNSNDLNEHGRKLKAQKARIQASIQRLLLAMRRLDSEVANSQLLLKELDSSTLEILWRSSFKCGSVFGKSRTDFEYRGTKGFSVLVDKNSMNTGTFSKEVIDPANGFYQVQYRSKFHTAAEASVTLKIERRLKEPNPAIIHGLRLSIITTKLKMNGQFSMIKSEIDSLTEEVRQRVLKPTISLFVDASGTNWYRLNGVPSLQEEITQLEQEKAVVDEALFTLSDQNPNMDSLLVFLQQDRQKLDALRSRQFDLQGSLVTLKQSLLELMTESEETSKVFQSLRKLILMVGFANPLTDRFLQLFETYELVRQRFPGESS